MMETSDNLPLECSDAEGTQSVPCPSPSELPGPTCDPEGTLPQLANEPAEQPTLTINEPDRGPATTLCWNPKVGYDSDKVGGATVTGPGIKGSFGECDGPGSFGATVEGSAGKVSVQGGNVTNEAEGPSMRAGFNFNPNGENRIGAQLNGASVNTTIDGPNGQTKFGLSAGIGGEVRAHNGPDGIGTGLDIGPISFDDKTRLPVQAR